MSDKIYYDPSRLLSGETNYYVCISTRGNGKQLYLEKMKALLKQIRRDKFLSIPLEAHIKSLAKPYNTYAILNRLLNERGNNDKEST